MSGNGITLDNIVFEINKCKLLIYLRDDNVGCKLERSGYVFQVRWHAREAVEVFCVRLPHSCTDPPERRDFSITAVSVQRCDLRCAESGRRL